MLLLLALLILTNTGIIQRHEAPDQGNEVNITIKQVRGMFFGFPVHIQFMFALYYIVLLCVK